MSQINGNTDVVNVIIYIIKQNGSAGSLIAEMIVD